MIRRSNSDVQRCLIAAAICLALAPAPASAATFVLINADPPWEGFNDPTAVTPIGGNPGTTRGQQRLNVFARGLEYWGDRITQQTAGGQELPVRVLANFTPISECNQSGGVLGFAGAAAYFSNFGAGQTNVWYPAALADHVLETDREPPGTAENPDGADIVAAFNEDVDEDSCLGSRKWYYGYDGMGGNDIDLLSTIIHEVGHGMGFATVVDLGTGIKPSGRDDVYMQNLVNAATGRTYPQMSDLERISASQATGSLQWTGPAVSALVAEGVLSNGFNAATDRIEMYAPSPQERGSSVSHYSNFVAPNEIMEPRLSGPVHNLELTMTLMQDIGWTDLIECGDADRNGSRSAVDALIALQTSVGSNDCLPALCDPNSSGSVTATDSLIMLQGSVGQEVTYSCGLAAS